ncbi:MAG: tyrosine-type recombinase/integrase [Candidatus Aenigmarchaeota archaeon]|nr:tyrosine-type recombinase/integrase [Candidatus Aenigmarchaeota archaeon]
MDIKTRQCFSYLDFFKVHYPYDYVYVKQFFEKALANKLTYSRVNIYLRNLKLMKNVVKKPFSQWTKDDVNAFAVWVNSNNRYSEWTKALALLTMRKFFQILNGFNWNDKKYPDIVSWLKVSVDKSKLRKLKSSDIITKDELTKMISRCDNSRDKALLIVLFESGARISEILNMNLNDIYFEQIDTPQGKATICVISVMGKTGQREIMLVESVPLLKEYLSQHPYRDRPDYPLWLTYSKKNRHQRLTYDAFVRQLKKICKRAALQKRIYPHLFRHSSVTYYSKILTDQQLKKRYGWSNDSKMLNIYSHLTQNDVNMRILESFGLVKKESETNPTMIKRCLVCGYENSFDSDFCMRCNNPVSENGLRRLQEIRESREKSLLQRIEELERVQKEILDIINNDDRLPLIMLENYKKIKKGQ